MAEQQPITVYFIGDKDGPDRFGIVYDTEDEAKEVARENEEQAWRVSVIPDWDNAVHLPFEDDEDEEEDDEETAEAMRVSAAIDEAVGQSRAARYAKEEEEAHE